MMILAERYDTNVLRRPSNAIPPELSKDDMVTTMSPRILVKSRGGWADVNGMIGAIGEVHAFNPSLNYVGMTGQGGVALTPLVSRMLRNATLNVSGTVLYTPTPPAFIRPDQTSPFFTGLQFFRNNTLHYSVGGDSVYTLSTNTFVQGSYRFSEIKFFDPNVVQGVGLVGTTNHQAAVSPGVRISQNDTLTTSYLANFYNQVGRGSYRTHSGTLGWLRNWSQNLSTQFSGGAQYLEPRTITFGGVTNNFEGIVIPTGSASIIYGSNARIFGDIVNSSRQLMGLELSPGETLLGGIASLGSYSVRLSYTFQAFPLLAQGGGLIKGHVFGATANFGLTSQLTIFGGANYSRNTGVGGTFSFEAIAGNAGIAYLATPSLTAHVLYTYYNSVSFAGVGNFPAINHQSAVLTITYAFEGGSRFFQGAGFGRGFFGSDEETK